MMVTAVIWLNGAWLFGFQSVIVVAVTQLWWRHAFRAENAKIGLQPESFADTDTTIAEDTNSRQKAI